MGRKIKDVLSSGGEESRKNKGKRKLQEEDEHIEAQINGEDPEILVSKKEEMKKKKKNKEERDNGSELGKEFDEGSGKKEKKKKKEKDENFINGEAKKDDEETEEEKKSYGGVVVSGKNFGDSKYSPLNSFSDSKLPENVLECCKTFDKPSPIQSHAWPFLLDGRDFIGIAQTGSGIMIIYTDVFFFF